MERKKTKEEIGYTTWRHIPQMIGGSILLLTPVILYQTGTIGAVAAIALGLIIWTAASHR